MWDVDVAGSAVIPHSSVSDSFGFVSGSLGYLVTRDSEVRLTASGLFVNGGQNVTLGGFYRYYFRTPNPRFLPFVGAEAGGNILHASGFGTNSNFAALGSAGLRIFAARHVAFEIAYDLLYIHVSGVGFTDSSASQVSVGFAHVFGR